VRAAVAFSTLAAREELRDRLNILPGVAIPTVAVEKQVFIPFASLAVDHGAAFFKVMDGVVERLRGEMPAAAA
jgi:hypothetical protein